MRLLENTIYIDDLKKAISNKETAYLCNKKILITGGTGLIGSAIVDLVLFSNKTYGSNIHIYLASRNKSKAEDRFDQTKCITWVPYDALKPLKFSEPVDYIIHCAGNASPELYVTRAVETMLGNFFGINYLLDYAAKLNDCKVMYVSSSEVYGVKNNIESFSEEEYGFLDILGNRASYASAKRAAETLCKAYYEEYGVPTCIARPGHIFGPTATMSDGRVSSTFAYKAAQGQELTLKSSGNQIRSYMYCLDCARAILRVMESGIPGQAYNICGSEATSIRALSEYYAEAGKVKLSYTDPSEMEKLSFNPMNNSSLDNTKLYALGYKTIFSVREGATHTIDILRSVIW